MTEHAVNPLPHSNKYRADIDGLRAIAVLLVVVFHAFPELDGGGFVGVDVFFVISGFLITGIIVNELGQGRFSFKTFYARRIKRIYPALLVVLTACYVFGWFNFLPDEFAALGKHMAGGAGFVANMVLWSESGYFDVQAELKPLLHLWSLGVEEQFYFLWPLLLFLAVRQHFALRYLLPLIFIASFITNIVDMSCDPSGAFYLPHTRFWELMSGAMLAYWSRKECCGYWQNHFLGRLAGLPGFKHSCAGLGLLLLILAVLLLDKHSAFPGWWAVLPTLGAVLILAAGQQAWVNKKILAHPLLVFIGLISYPLYLWHWPLLAFARTVSVDKLSLELRALLALSSVLLAWLTYRFVEIPLRFGQRPVNKTRLFSLLMLLLFCIGYSSSINQGLPFRMPEKAGYDAFFNHSNYTKNYKLLKVERHECNFYDITNNTVKANIDVSCVTAHSKQRVFLWGDSHMQHLNYGLSKILPPEVSLLQAGASGCPPSATDLSPDPLLTCNKANRFVWQQLEALKPATVIMAQQRGHEISQYDAVTARLKKLGIKNIILVGPVPQWQPFLYKIVLRKYWQHMDNRINGYLSKGVLETDGQLKAHYKNNADLTYVSLVERLCNAQGCLTYLNNNRKEALVTYDYGHFTLPASEYVARNILAPYINKALADSLLQK